MIALCHDHGMEAVAAGGLLAIMGLFDLVGTTASGWLTDRFDPRKLLFAYYGLRGLSLIYLPFANFTFFGLSLFAVFYGLDWIATVPPTLALANQAFGIKKAPVLFGWISASHQVGRGGGGLFRRRLAHRHRLLSGFLCHRPALSRVAAACLALMIGTETSQNLRHRGSLSPGKTCREPSTRRFRTLFKHIEIVLDIFRRRPRHETGKDGSAEHKAEAVHAPRTLLYSSCRPCPWAPPWRPAPAFAFSRVKDLVEVEGIRDNMLVGYGLVVGLNGTGDSLKNAPFTQQSIQTMLERLGVNTRGQTMQTKNVAAVMVTANLPAFAGAGLAHRRVGVSAMGDAKNLQGGTLLVTPLFGADGQIYAVARARSRSAASPPRAMPPA